MSSRKMVIGKIPAEAQPMINKMTNWQRGKWAKAGYPSDPSNLTKFVNLKRPVHVSH
jgi:hypothetical protein